MPIIKETKLFRFKHEKELKVGKTMFVNNEQNNKYRDFKVLSSDTIMLYTDECVMGDLVHDTPPYKFVTNQKELKKDEINSAHDILQRSGLFGVLSVSYRYEEVWPQKRKTGNK